MDCPHSRQPVRCGLRFIGCRSPATGRRAPGTGPFPLSVSQLYLSGMAVHVTSEIGALKSVLVHPPGAELFAVTPSTREDYLYDDIMDVASAQREHRRFVAILERFAEVNYVRDLLAEVLSDPEVKQGLIRDTLDILPSVPIARELEK